MSPMGAWLKFGMFGMVLPIDIEVTEARLRAKIGDISWGREKDLGQINVVSCLLTADMYTIICWGSVEQNESQYFNKKLWAT